MTASRGHCERAQTGITPTLEKTMTLLRKTALALMLSGLVATPALAVPGVDAQRHLIIMQPTESDP